MRAGEVLTHPVAITVAAAVAESGALLAATTLLSHREKTHRSLELDPALKGALYATILPFNDPNSWAAVHRVHHNVPDADMYPFIQVADYTDWRDANPDQAADHPDLPETFDNLDFYARDIPIATVREIGTKARELVAGEYEPPGNYEPVKAAGVLDTLRPRFLYENIRGKAWRKPRDPDKPRTLEDVRYKIRDPHSPALHPDRVRGILRDNVPLFVDVDRRFNQDGLPPDLERTWLQEKLQKHRKAVLIADIVGHVVVPAAIGALFGQRKPKEVIRNGLIGGAAISAAARVIVEAGRQVNGRGHSGDDPSEAAKTGEITLNDNSSITTNAKLLLGYVTADEAGWQRNHHEHPDWIAFAKRWTEAPLGKAVEWLAKKGIGMKPGKGFPGEVRPDMAHESVLMLLRERDRTRKEANLAQAA